MTYYVYLLISEQKINNKYISYVGYTKDIQKRIKFHNEGKGAKFTRGKKWELAYYKKFISKNLAMSEEFKLKKNSKLRNQIKKNFNEIKFSHSNKSIL